MKNDDCPECAAFAAELRAALKDLHKQSDHVRSREEVQQTLARYLSLPEEAIIRLRESFYATKAGQIYTRFIGASHQYRLH
jgi:Zn-dependent peptidase ImmA (M78 family)